MGTGNNRCKENEASLDRSETQEYKIATNIRVIYGKCEHDDNRLYISACCALDVEPRARAHTFIINV